MYCPDLTTQNVVTLSPRVLLSPRFCLSAPRIFIIAHNYYLSACLQNFFLSPRFCLSATRVFIIAQNFCLSSPRIFIIAQNFCPCPEFLSLGQNFLSPLSAVNLKQIVFHMFQISIDSGNDNSGGDKNSGQ